MNHWKLRRAVLGLALGGAAILVAACDGPKGQPEVTQNVFVPDAPPPETTPVTANQSITITKSVWDDYQVYLGRVGRIGGGYYAVTEDGTGGGSWACGEALCEQGLDAKAAAMKQCQQANPSKTCVIFAKNDKPQMHYEVMP